MRAPAAGGSAGIKRTALPGWVGIYTLACSGLPDAFRSAVGRYPAYCCRNSSQRLCVLFHFWRNGWI
ncbi:hypothetical protein ID80_000596 [Salmonella enterica subsp. enterica serovar Ball]|nr:hypothetical protein [Salmonella enterica subsp. enterica serovar Ball]